MIPEPISKTAKKYGRGLAGGLLFSLPMLYTMELWWAGFLSDSMRLSIYFLVGIFVLIMYNRFVGLNEDSSLWEGFLESVDEMGLGILLTLFILFLTGRITPNMSLHEISGKTIVEAVTVAIGISVGKTQLRGDKEDQKGSKESKETMADKNKRRNPHYHLIRSVNLALCGSILVASNVAPTEEIVVIALENEPYKIFLIALLSISLGAAILYHINFKGAKEWIVKPKSNWDALAGTLVMYAVALVSSAFMLWFFGRFADNSLYAIVAQTAVLGFPASLGASAGRLLIQS